VELVGEDMPRNEKSFLSHDLGRGPRRVPDDHISFFRGKKEGARERKNGEILEDDHIRKGGLPGLKKDDPS